MAKVVHQRMRQSAECSLQKKKRLEEDDKAQYETGEGPIGT